MWLYEISLIHKNYFDIAQRDENEPISNVLRSRKKEMEEHWTSCERAELFNHS